MGYGPKPTPLPPSKLPRQTLWGFLIVESKSVPSPPSPLITGGPLLPNFDLDAMLKAVEGLREQAKSHPVELRAEPTT